MNTLNISISPFKLLNSYEQADAKFFFGRELETRQLADTLMQCKFLLLYGGSGTGKTSLIKCGLSGMFSPSDWMPLFVRRNNNFVDSLKTALIDQLNHYKNSNIYDEGTSYENLSLRDLIKHLFDLTYLPIYLILDQFEEIFTLGTISEQDDFFSTLNSLRLFEEDMFCRILIITREEYIAHFYKYERSLPFLFDFRFRVEKMRYEQLLKVVKGLITIDYPGYLPISSEDGISEQILENLIDVKGEVDLTTLQVYLDRLYKTAWEKLEKKDHSYIIFNKDLVGESKLQNILADFLNQQIGIVNQRIGNMNVLNIALQVLYKFVTSQGVKQSLGVNTIYKELSFGQINIGLPVIKNCLDHLASSDIRLLNRLQSVITKEEQFEIVHDQLAEQIFAKFNSSEISQREAKSTIENKLSRYKETKEFLSLGEIELIKKTLNTEMLDQNKKMFLKKSVQVYQNKQIQRRVTTISAILFGLVFLIVAIFARISYYEAQTKKLEAQVVSTSYENPTIALFLAKKAWDKHPSEQLMISVSKLIYGQTIFYSNPVLHIKNIRRIKPIKNMQFFLGITEEINNLSSTSTLFLSTKTGKNLFTYSDDCGIMFENFNSTDNSITFYTYCGFEKKLDMKGNLIHSIEKATLDDGFLIGISHSGLEKVFQFYAAGEGSYLTKNDTISKELDLKINFAAFSKNDRYLALGGSELIEVFDKERKLIRSIYAPDGKIFSAIAISPNGDKIAGSFSDGEMYIWDVFSNGYSDLPPKTASTEPLSSLAFSNSGDAIVTSAIDGRIQIWRLKTQQFYSSHDLPVSIGLPIFSKNSKYIQFKDEGKNGELINYALNIKTLNIVKKNIDFPKINTYDISKFQFLKDYNYSFNVSNLGSYTLIGGINNKNMSSNIKLINSKGAIIHDFGEGDAAYFSPNGNYLIISTKYPIYPAIDDYYFFRIYRTPWSVFESVQPVELSANEKAELGLQ